MLKGHNTGDGGGGMEVCGRLEEEAMRGKWEGKWMGTKVDRCGLLSV